MKGKVASISIIVSILLTGASITIKSSNGDRGLILPYNTHNNSNSVQCSSEYICFFPANEPSNPFEININNAAIDIAFWFAISLIPTALYFNNRPQNQNFTT